MANTRSAKEVIAALNLAPHPEKGYFVETFRDAHLSSDKRSYGTCIYYLLEGETGLSHWHRVLDATEVWHYYAGAPLQLSLSWDDGKPVRDVVLGNDLWNVSEHPFVENCPLITNNSMLTMSRVRDLKLLLRWGSGSTRSA